MRESRGDGREPVVFSSWDDEGAVKGGNGGSVFETAEIAKGAKVGLGWGCRGRDAHAPLGREA